MAFARYGRRIGKVLGLSLAGATTVGTGLYLHHVNYDVSSIGAVRIARAGATCAWIFLDYKWTMRRLIGLDTEGDEYAEKINMAHERSANKLLKLATSNGGVWIKVGQHLASLEYLLPPEYIEVLSVLHSRAPASTLPEIKQVFSEDMGKSVDDVFESFDVDPVGTASLAQVHKATLRNGSHVAVKVQHPRVKPHSFVDIATMEFLVKAAERIFTDFHFLWLAEETKRNLPLELDFVQEGWNAERVRRMLSHLPFLKVPKIHWELTTDRVLTMEFCEGCEVKNLDAMLEMGVSPRDVCRKMGKLYSEMIFVHGYVHCDPHPGNVLIQKAKDGDATIVLLDHGLYTTLTDEFRLNYAHLWLAMLDANVEQIKRYATALNVGELYPLLASMLTARSWESVSSGMQQKKFTAAESHYIRQNVPKYIRQISVILHRVPREMILIFKTNDLLRSIEHKLRTLHSKTSFIMMLRCCSLAVYEQQCDQIGNHGILRVVAWFRLGYTLAKLNFYECFLDVHRFFFNIVTGAWGLLGYAVENAM